VRLREALGSSLNVPAVWTLDRVGIAPFLDELHDLGFASLDESPEHYGPALAVGDGEVTLLALTNAYATLARDGVWKPVVAVRDVETRGGSHATAREESERRVLPSSITSVITDVLADKDARVAAFGGKSALELPFPVAAKTGTSKGYRDNWTVGYTREVTVGVWVGNFDGTPMEGVSGITGAAPLFHAVMDAAMRGREPAPFAVDRAAYIRARVCPLSGEAASDACPHAIEEWVPAGKPLDPCSMHMTIGAHVVERFPPEYAAWARSVGRDASPSSLSADGIPASAVRIAWPADGSTFLVEPDRSRASQALAIRVLAPPGTPRVALKVDGKLASTTGDPYVARWRLDPGDHVLVAEAPGLPASAPVRVRVQ
jgi:penicillin-binding protein 1C